MSGRGFTSVFAADLDAYHGYPLEMIAHGHLSHLRTRPASDHHALALPCSHTVHPTTGQSHPHDRSAALMGAARRACGARRARSPRTGPASWDVMSTEVPLP